MSYKQYETERLILKPTTEEDAAYILELMNSPKWIQYIGDRNLKTLEDAEAYIRLKMLPQLERLGFSNYTIIRKSDGVKMGSCGLYDREGVKGVDIGYALLEAYEGQGYAIESAIKIRDLGFSDFGQNKISAITAVDNYASQKLLKKLGLEFVKKTILPEETEEVMLFVLRKEA